MSSSAYSYCNEYPTELHNGQAVAMAPSATVRHYSVSDNIAKILERHLRGKACAVFKDSVDVILSDKDRFIPDVMVVCDSSKIKNGGVHGAPDLVVEVLSPSTARRDKGYKKKLYEKHGVKEYWLVNTDSKSIEVHLLKDGKFEFDNDYAVHPEAFLRRMTAEERGRVITEFSPSIFPDLVASLDDVFKSIFDD